jgi:D-3-phosphoglycerate dehydrogenase / 2-oxoglutarate reductase
VTILLLESLHPEAHEALTAAARLLSAEEPDAVRAILDREPVEAIITRGRGQVGRPLLQAAPRLRVVARAGVGLDNVDVGAASELGIRVINSPGSTTIAVAEQTMLLMAALVRGLYTSVHGVKTGDWEARRQYRGDDLAGKRLGLIGLGQIGQRVARLAAAYDMEVVYWNRREKDVPYRLVSLPELLAGADVVSIHVALAPETRHLIGARELEAIKPGAFLVNTARGAIVDQAAVVAALDSERLAGFAADVLEQEPPDPSDPILTHPKTVITPHTAALTDSTYRTMCLRTARNVIAALRDEPVEPGCVANEAELRSRGPAYRPLTGPLPPRAGGEGRMQPTRAKPDG